MSAAGRRLEEAQNSVKSPEGGVGRRWGMPEHAPAVAGAKRIPQ